MSELYNAAAVFQKLPGIDTPYLCKFAVTEQAIGNGLANVLWDQIRADYPQGFFWRSHSQCEEVRADACVIDAQPQWPYER